MKLNSYLDLQLIDFLDIVSGGRDARKHIIERKTLNERGKIIKDEIVGSLESLEDMGFTMQGNPIGNDFKSIVARMKEEPVYQFDDFSNIEIYNYLEHITSNFDPEKVKRIWFDVDCYYHLTYRERVNEESMEIHLKNDWPIPYKEVDLTKLTDKGRELHAKFPPASAIPDYDKMLSKTHIGLGYSLDYLRGILKSKLATSPYQELLRDLKGYIKGTQENFEYFMTHKEPHEGRQMEWIGSVKAEALIFAGYAKITPTKFNKCFRFTDGGKLTESNRSSRPERDFPISQILDKHKSRK